MGFIFTNGRVLNTEHIAYIVDIHSQMPMATMSDGVRFRLTDKALDDLIRVTTTSTLPAEPGRYVVVSLDWDAEEQKLLRDNYTVLGWIYHADELNSCSAPITTFGEMLPTDGSDDCLLDISTGRAHVYDGNSYLQMPFREWAASIQEKFKERYKGKKQ